MRLTFHFQLFWPRCQHSQRCCNGLHHSNCCSGECNCYMGVRPLLIQQSCPWGVPQCYCCHSHDCGQGLSPFHSSFMSHLVYQIQVSGQWIEYFEKLQLQCKITEPLRIPLHSNIWWGSAHHMLDHSYQLWQASKTSVVSTDLNTETPCT